MTQNKQLTRQEGPEATLLVGDSNLTCVGCLPHTQLSHLPRETELRPIACLCTHRNTCTQTYTNMHTDTQMSSYTLAHIPSHTHIHTHTHGHTQKDTDTQIYTCTYTCICTCTHRHTNADTLTYTHMLTDTHRGIPYPESILGKCYKHLWCVL